MPAPCPDVPHVPTSLSPPQGGIPAPCLLCPLCPYRSPGWDASPVSPTSHISATLWSGGIQAPRPCVPVALPLPREECQPCVPRVPTSLSFPRVGCQPRVPCFPHVLTPAPDSVPQPPRSYDAFSTFFLNSQGLIRCHRVDKVRPGGHRGTLQCPSCPPPAPNFVPPQLMPAPTAVTEAKKLLVAAAVAVALAEPGPALRLALKPSATSGDT